MKNNKKHRIPLATSYNLKSTIRAIINETTITLNHLSPLDNQNICNTLQRHTAIFAKEIKELGKTTIVQHYIPTIGEPVALQPYRTPEASSNQSSENSV